MKSKYELVGKELEMYFDSDADMLELIRSEQITSITVEVDTIEEKAIWYSSDITEIDDYVGAIEKLAEIQHLARDNYWKKCKEV
jgi:hypothetical protein